MVQNQVINVCAMVLLSNIYGNFIKYFIQNICLFLKKYIFQTENYFTYKYDLKVFSSNKTYFIERKINLNFKII